MKHLELWAQSDRHGKMPDLTEMLKMRSNKEAYRFYWMVFGPLVYGKDSYRKEVFAQFMTVEMARKVFTENDEAWGLLVLEDNWDMWWEMATEEYKNHMRERNIDVPSSSEEDSSTDTNGLPKSQEEDVISEGGTMDRRKIARKSVMTQLYSSKKTMGMNQQGFDRLELLEEKVHNNREKDGRVFYDYLRYSFIQVIGGELLEGTKEVVKTSKKRVLGMM